ncbi:hypothetical protein EYC98_02910 [Halieaceae bacterium IMCC14734]|uniref:Uncharacterized protein n=1 Tax=Candidatus Litorirhabdus singularis TaxID=2518993 RepID=A0ABT3TC09_9GAMM|nr:hypothetical protein [Candidatus Litorirhabdus singularis]MCX2979810.1 hypothetical protein [Candidatus Litorirhabdus singularis]
MIPRLPETLWLVAMFVITATQPAYATKVIGEARDLSSGELLYKELHRCDDDGILCSIAYVNEGGDVIAKKTMDYSRGAIAPVLQVNDYRFDREVVIDAEAEAGLVIDAGFDNFIRNNWQVLESSRKIRFNFLIPGRDSPLKMEAHQAVPEDCEANTLCLVVALDNWLLAAITDPILLTYSRDNRRLLRYRGISNLASNDGKSQVVDIRYTYTPVTE